MPVACNKLARARRFRKAGELGLAVGVMPFKGLSQHLENLEDFEVMGSWGEISQNGGKP